MTPARIHLLLAVGMSVVLAAGFLAGGWPPDDIAATIFALRGVRLAAAGLAGGLLALAGLLMQAVLRNPLADPYILGASGGASLGALTALSLGMGAAVAQGSAFAGALTALALAWLIARRADAARLLLAGVMVAAASGAAVGVLLTLSSDQTLRGMLFWMLGDASSVTSSTALIVPAIVLLLLLAWTQARAKTLTLLAAGEVFARGLGLQTTRVRWEAIAAAALCTATALWLVGSLGFVGLVAPHAARMLLGFGVVKRVFATTLLGAGFAMLADTLARTVAAPVQLPFGAITALIGAPLFCVLLLRGQVALGPAR